MNKNCFLWILIAVSVLFFPVTVEAGTNMVWAYGNSWDLATPNWTPDNVNFYPWNNGNYDTALLGYPGGGSGIITIAGGTSITAGGVDFVTSAANIDGYTQAGASLNFDTASPTSAGTLSVSWSSTSGGGPWIDGKIGIPAGKTLDVVGTVVSATDYSSLYLWNDSGVANNYAGMLSIDDCRVVPCGGGGGGAGILPSTSAGTAVKDGGTLALFYQGNYNTGPLTLNGAGVGSALGALQLWPANDPGNITWQSNIILNSDSAISSTPYLGGEMGIITGSISETSGGPKSLGVIGTGVLVLANNNSYTGNTAVINSTLALSGAGSIASSPLILLQANGKLDVTTVTGGFTLAGTQTLQGNGSVVGNVVAASSSHIAPGESVGTLNVAGDLDLRGTLDVEYNGSQLDTLAVTGELKLTGGKFDFSSISGLTDVSYIFANYGSLNGAAAEVGVPDGYSVVYGYGGKNIALVVPEPSTMILLSLGLMGLAGWVRRR
jgi:fibronectin-binding autotransporter adhesin